MNREDFIFSIGYQDDTAIVDKQAQKSLGKLSSFELLEKGLLRASFCALLYDKQENQYAEYLESFNKEAGTSYNSIEELKRLFGVYGLPEGVTKTTAV